MRIIFCIFAYHIALISLGLSVHLKWSHFSLYVPTSIWIDVSLLGLAGGCTYCIRSLYIQYCVKQEWDSKWIVWHVIRPFVSIICGAVSLLFIKAGLLLFEVSSLETQNHYGIYLFAFVAGLNVDSFIKKIESTFKEVVGIKESRTSRGK